MGAERRLENRRMKITRKMELACLDTGRYFTGATEDVSDSGIRACMDHSPKPGSGVMVRLFWDEKKKPVETFGRVAWSSPLPAGSGIEVGLMLGADSNIRSANKSRQPTQYHRCRPSVRPQRTTARNRTSVSTPLENACVQDDSNSIENKRTLAAILSPIQSRVIPVSSAVALSRGESFEVDIQGKRTWAKITAAGEIGIDGQMKIILELKDRRLWKRANGSPGAARPVSSSHGRRTSETRASFALSVFTWKQLPLGARAKIVKMVDALGSLGAFARRQRTLVKIAKRFSQLKRRVLSTLQGSSYSR